MKNILKIGSLFLFILFFSSCFKGVEPSYFICEVDGVSWNAENGGSAISDGKVVGFTGKATDGSYLNWYLTLEEGEILEEKEYQVLDDVTPILATYCDEIGSGGNCIDAKGNYSTGDKSVVGVIEITKITKDIVEGTFEFTLGTVDIKKGEFKLYYTEI